jgi:uroporphyrinogen III methyltransferase/synthase
MNPDKTMPVYLIGAGPGDPGLITVKGSESIQAAAVVVYDRLVNPQLLRFAREDAELIYVGKSADCHALKQEEINALLVRKAREGKTVVRLKGGDPFVFGRGGEEAETLKEAGILFEIVPGVTSAIAVPAYAGIPVTHRGYTSSLGIITGHEDPTKEISDVDWAKIATGMGTLVFLMGVRNLPSIVEALLAHGRPPDTPVAIIQRGTQPSQRTVTGRLDEIVLTVQEAGIEPPAITVVGEVVGLREKLRWFDTRPLFGRRVLVTRSREQASALSARLRDLGADPAEFPTIRTDAPEDYGPVDRAIDGVGQYEWIIFTSVNGVKHFVGRLRVKRLDGRALAGTRLAAIGPATAAELETAGLRADYMPDSYVAEAIAEGLEAGEGQRVLLPRADLARSALVEELEKKDYVVDEVVAYRTLLHEHSPGEIAALFADRFDVATFTSSSTVRNLAAILQRERGDDWRAIFTDTTIACIGPITAQTAREMGLEPDVVAKEHTIEGLVQAILERC